MPLLHVSQAVGEVTEHVKGIRAAHLVKLCEIAFEQVIYLVSAEIYVIYIVEVFFAAYLVERTDNEVHSFVGVYKGGSFGSCLRLTHFNSADEVEFTVVFFFKSRDCRDRIKKTVLVAVAVVHIVTVAVMLGRIPRVALAMVCDRIGDKSEPVGAFSAHTEVSLRIDGKLCVRVTVDEFHRRFISLKVYITHYSTSLKHFPYLFID